jgi:polar amino acid transport system substrate-binding protein
MKIRKLKSSGKGHQEEVASFLSALQDGKPGPIGFRSICLTTLATFRIIDSLNTGLPQEVSVHA